MEQQRNEAILAERLGPSPTISDTWTRTMRLARRYPTTAIGLVVIFLIVLMGLLAPVLFTVDPREVDPVNRLLSPSGTNWFGTDFIGRDVYARTLYGSRISLLVGFIVAATSTTAAVVLGLLTGYFRRVDTIVMRFMDGLMAIPIILLAIAMMATLGGSVQNVIIALSVVETPRMVRIVRASVLSLREQMYVDAALSIGASTPRILFRHIFPGTIAPVIVQATFICADAILIEAGLSFLGAGTPPEIPSWGTMMAEGRKAISQAIWVIGIPGMFLTITVLAINLAGDGLRDILDPKLARRM